MVRAVVTPATHSSTPNRESEDGEAQGPPGPKAQDHQYDPGWLSEFIDPCCDGHDGTSL
jgi:hypothetical protein